MKQTSFDNVLNDVRKKKLQRVYLLHGEEALFIDQLVNIFSMDIIPPENMDFDLSVMYGQDVSCNDIISEIMQYPMLSSLRIVIVKEAQNISDIDRLSSIINTIPQTSTLVIAYKKKYDKRKSLYKAIEQTGCIFESNKIYDSKLPDFIISTFNSKNLSIDPQTAYMMSEYVGNNLKQILLEIDKISINLTGVKQKVSIEDIKEHIGINKDFDSFEFLRAICSNNVSKVFQLVFFFANNERQNLIQVTLSILYNFFSNLMQVYYLPHKDEQYISQTLKISSFAAREYLLAASNFSVMKCFDIIHEIRMSDAKSKGVGGSYNNGELLKELVINIFS